MRAGLACALLAMANPAVIQQWSVQRGTFPVRAVVVARSEAEASAILARPDTPDTLPADRRLRLVAAGPVLDSPDRAEWRHTKLDGNRIEILVEHTSARLQGVPLRRNVPWQPILDVPLPGALPDGVYDARVLWRSVTSLADGRHLADGVESRVRFRLTDR